MNEAWLQLIVLVFKVEKKERKEVCLYMKVKHQFNFHCYLLLLFQKTFNMTRLGLNYDSTVANLNFSYLSGTEDVNRQQSKSKTVGHNLLIYTCSHFQKSQYTKKENGT